MFFFLIAVPSVSVIVGFFIKMYFPYSNSWPDRDFGSKNYSKTSLIIENCQKSRRFSKDSFQVICNPQNIFPGKISSSHISVLFKLKSIVLVLLKKSEK